MTVPQCLLLSYTHILIVLPYVEPTVSIIASLLNFNVVFNLQSVIILHFLLTWNLWEKNLINQFIRLFPYDQWSKRNKRFTVWGRGLKIMIAYMYGVIKMRLHINHWWRFFNVNNRYSIVILKFVKIFPSVIIVLYVFSLCFSMCFHI